MAMRAFTRVVETGSFTRAADSLNMPIATLSKFVKALEAHLEIRLLHRTTRRWSRRRKARSIMKKRSGCSLISKISIPRSRLSRHTERTSAGGYWRFDCPRRAHPLLPDFMQRYPDIRIDLGVADRPVDLISGNVDCVIRGGPLNDSTLIARHLGDADMVTCATPGYLKKHGVPAYPQELRNGHKLISYLSPVTGRPFPFRFRKGGEVQEIGISHYLGVNESNAHGSGGGRIGHHSDVYIFSKDISSGGYVTRNFKRLAPGGVSVSRGLPAKPASDASP